jgi:hypothetical protein
MVAALALEGEFSEDGLAAMAGDANLASHGMTMQHLAG